MIGAGTLDSLPHNGAVVTLLAVCGSTHRESYLDIVMVAIVGAIIALVAVIVLGSSSVRSDFPNAGCFRAACAQGAFRRSCAKNRETGLFRLRRLLPRARFRPAASSATSRRRAPDKG